MRTAQTNPRSDSIIGKVDAYLNTKNSKGRFQTLTPAEAHVTFGTMRLASAIEELRNKYGRPILTTIKSNPETKVEYASYSKEHFKKGDAVVVQTLRGSEKACVGVIWDIGARGRIVDTVDGNGCVTVEFTNGDNVFVIESDLRRLI